MIVSGLTRDMKDRQGFESEFTWAPMFLAQNFKFVGFFLLRCHSYLWIVAHGHVAQDCHRAAGHQVPPQLQVLLQHPVDFKLCLKFQKLDSTLH